MGRLSTTIDSVFFPAKISVPRMSGRLPMAGGAGAAFAVTTISCSSEAACAALGDSSTTSSDTARSRTVTLIRRVARESCANVSTYDPAPTLANS
jgi:hypothetical protein